MIKMPTPIQTAFPRAVAGTFSNSMAGNPMAGMPHGKPLQKGRGGVKVATNNPFQGAINKMSAMAPRKY